MPSEEKRIHNPNAVVSNHAAPPHLAPPQIVPPGRNRMGAINFKRPTRYVSHVLGFKLSSLFPRQGMSVPPSAVLAPRLLVTTYLVAVEPFSSNISGFLRSRGGKGLVFEHVETEDDGRAKRRPHAARVSPQQ